MSMAIRREREEVVRDRGMVLIGRIRSEFLEMPGMRLTAAQAARLWAEDLRITERLLDELAATGFLYKNRSRAYLGTSVA